MTVVKIIISIIIFYFLALFQSSFLVHFNIFSWTPNIILIIVVTLGIIESSKKYFAIWVALIGGFFLDIFSVRFFGFNILMLVLICLFFKFIFKYYARVPFLEKI